MDADTSRELRRLRIETAARRAEFQGLHEGVRAAEDDVEVARAVYLDADAENRMLRTVMAEHRLGELAWLDHDELVTHMLHLGHEPPDPCGRGVPAHD